MNSFCTMTNERYGVYYDTFKEEIQELASFQVVCLTFLKCEQAYSITHFYVFFSVLHTSEITLIILISHFPNSYISHIKYYRNFKMVPTFTSFFIAFSGLLQNPTPTLFLITTSISGRVPPGQVNAHYPNILRLFMQVFFWFSHTFSQYFAKFVLLFK